MRQKLARFGLQATGNVVTVGVVGFLVLAWVVTVPFIQMSDQFAGKSKLKNKNT